MMTLKMKGWRQKGNKVSSLDNQKRNHIKVWKLIELVLEML